MTHFTIYFYDLKCCTDVPISNIYALSVFSSPDKDTTEMFLWRTYDASRHHTYACFHDIKMYQYPMILRLLELVNCHLFSCCYLIMSQLPGDSG